MRSRRGGRCHGLAPADPGRAHEPTCGTARNSAQGAQVSAVDNRCREMRTASFRLRRQLSTAGARYRPVVDREMAAPRPRRLQWHRRGPQSIGQHRIAIGSLSTSTPLQSKMTKGPLRRSGHRKMRPSAYRIPDRISRTQTYAAELRSAKTATSRYPPVLCTKMCVNGPAEPPAAGAWYSTAAVAENGRRIN